MTKTILILGLSLLLLTGCDVKEMSSLKEISKPYTGEYRCETLLLGSTNLLQQYKYIKLNLKPDGDFLLSYRDTADREGEYGGEYTFKGDSVSFTAKNGLLDETRSFPYEKGKIYIQLPFSGKLLIAEFST